MFCGVYGEILKEAMANRGERCSVKVPLIIQVIFFIIIATIITTDSVSGQTENATGRIYGTWRTRQQQRNCKKELFCRYRSNDCMNYNSQNTWNCNQVNSALSSNNCIMKMCEKEKEMDCLTSRPSDEYYMVESNSCAIGKQCYAKRPPVTTTTTLAPPTGTTTSLILNTLSSVTDQSAATTDATLGKSTAFWQAPGLTGTTDETTTAATTGAIETTGGQPDQGFFEEVGK